MQRLKLHIALILILFQIHFHNAFSQKETNNWFFGYGAGLNFNGGIPINVNGGKIRSEECSASISDKNGNLLFYTNGDTIWDKNHNVMPNGFGLLANSQAMASSTQGSLIVSKPNSNNLYYVFSLDAGYFVESPLVYSIVDMNENAGMGEVITKNNILMPKARFFEKLTAIKHCNNRDIWIIIMGIDPEYNIEDPNHNKTKSVFLYSFLLTPYGVSNFPVISNLGDIKSATAIGQIKSNLQGTHLAFGSEYGYSLLKFDKETGQIINVSNFIGKEYSTSYSYGLEFSPDGNLLYFNKTQIDIATGNKVELGYSTVSQFQLASDGKIYFINYDSSQFIFAPGYDTTTLKYPPIIGLKGKTLKKKLSVINSPNIIGMGCNISYDTISLGNDTASFGLPNFPAYYFYHSSGEFTYQNDCPGDSTLFKLVNNPVLDSIKWIFGDDNSISTALNPKHVFSQVGSYNVSVVIYNAGIPDTTTQCVTIIGISGNAFEVTDTVICKDDKPITIGTSYPHIGNYLWNIGDTTAAITTNTIGNYWLTITNNCGSYTSNIYISETECNNQVENIIVPNVFSPNNDGINDVFSVAVKNIQQLNYQIYNRWGIKVADGSISNLTNSFQTIPLWDGRTIAGVECTDGVYYYLIEYKNVDGSSLNNKGFFELIR